MKNLFLIMSLIISGIFCVTAKLPSLESQKRETIDSTRVSNKTPTDSLRIEKINNMAPKSLSLGEWIGQEFVILEKQNMFKKFGYDMRLDDSSKKIDTVFETVDKKYLRCDKFGNRVFKVISILPSGNESKITLQDSSGLKITATTHKSAIKEIALKSDLESARQHWIGKTVYSKKGVISTLVESGFGNLRVKIQDSLLVYDVKLGVTPLPVNPIWLMVKTTHGEKGFIAVRYSWTNTMTDLIQNCNAWNDEILEENPQSLYKWNSDMWNIINTHQIIIGMNPDQVLLSWGEPLSKIQVSKNGSKQYCWKYSSQQLIFERDSLISIENLSSN